MDRADLGQLLEEYHNAAYGWALYCCRGDHEEAQEVLQIVYLRILENKAPFSGQSSFKTWLFAVIRRTAGNARRRLGRRLKQLEETFRKLPGLKPDSFDKVYRSQMEIQIATLLSGLSARQRQVLQLVFYHDLTIEEAARVMGVSTGSARTHYHRGKSHLRRQIEKLGMSQEYGI